MFYFLILEGRGIRNVMCSYRFKVCYPGRQLLTSELMELVLAYEIRLIARQAANNFTL